MIFISKYLGITDLEEHGVFDALIDKDSNFFINILRLKETEVPEFSSSYDTINTFFSGIASLLAAAKSKNSSDKFFRTALRKFDFKEVNGINLGFSESKNGSGIGQKLRLQILKDAFDIVKQGSTQPEIFQLVGLFEEGIGPDRLSDMIATIIKKDIIAYTKRIQKDYNIDQKHFPDKKFLSNGVIYNPIKKCPLYFVPSDILHELPIAKSWEDIDDVVDKNQCIRDEINEAIGEEWSKWATRQKKEYIREKIFKNPDKCSRVVETYKMATAESFNPYNDLEYTVAKISEKIDELISYLKCEQKKLASSFAVSTNIINLFKDWVENNQGWKIIQEMDSRKSFKEGRI